MPKLRAGDVIMASARKVWEVVKTLAAGKPEAAEYLEEGEIIIAAMEKGWADNKTKTPEMEDYYDELLVLAAEVGKVLAEQDTVAADEGDSRI